MYIISGTWYTGLKNICPKLLTKTVTINKLRNCVFQTKWASPLNPLGKFAYYSYNEVDFGNFGKIYNYNGRSAGFYKKNVTSNAHPESRDWPTSMRQLYQKKGKRDSCDCIYLYILPYLAMWQ